MSDPRAEDSTTCHRLGSVDATISAWIDRVDLTIVDDLAAADLVVVGLDHPDRYSAVEVARLLGTAPLARWVVCGSTWCEAIGRTRDVWPRGVVVPARLALGRLDAELAVLRGKRPPLPLTASRDEAWAFDHEPREPQPLTGRVRIDSPDRRLAETWAAIVQDAGLVVATDAEGPCDVVLFDGDPWNDAVRARLASHAGTPTIVLQNMPEGDVDGPVVPKLAPNGLLVATIRDRIAVATH